MAKMEAVPGRCVVLLDTHGSTDLRHVL